MVHWLSLLLSLTFVSSSWAASSSVLEEKLYFDFQKSITHHDKSLTGFTKFEQSLYVDALWDMVEEGSPAALKMLAEVPTFHYGLVEKLRLGILKLKYQQAQFLDVALINELTIALQSQKVDVKIIYILAAYEDELVRSGHAEIIELAKQSPRYNDVAFDAERKKEISTNVVADLFYQSPDVAAYMNGEYVKSVKIFMFCRDSRLYPCLMVMRNVHGEVVRNADGTIWTHLSLASSKQGLPSYYRNGNTPAGVHTIDSVMPAADQTMSFGKYRRLILNFVPKSRGETLHKSLLPASSYEDGWWKTGVVARDAGRNLLRIHGTGKLNPDSETPYFPFMRTSGCIAQRENTYDGVEYHDQRDLLNAILMAMDLEPSFENEPKAKGILYVMDLDDKNAPVTAEDLAAYGIE